VTPLLLTLTGGAGAGKTTVAAEFGEAVVLHGDDYYVTGRDRGVWLPDRSGTPRLDVGDPRSVDTACDFPLDVLLANYLDHRREAHTRHVEPLRDHCDLVVDGSLPAASIRAEIECAAPRWTL
jgi:uridine kinase